MDEALKIDLWTLREYRDQLIAENAPAEEWHRYRAWRDRVIASATAPAAARHPIDRRVRLREGWAGPAFRPNPATPTRDPTSHRHPARPMETHENLLSGVAATTAALVLTACGASKPGGPAATPHTTAAKPSAVASTGPLKLGTARSFTYPDQTFRVTVYRYKQPLRTDVPPASAATCTAVLMSGSARSA